MYIPSNPFPVEIQDALRTIIDIEDQFDELKGSFVHPQVVDFRCSDGTISVTPSSRLLVSSETADNTPKLACTSTNLNLHTYIKSLEKLLIKLDDVETCGDLAVQSGRQRVGGRINDEASWVSAYWKRVWTTYITEIEEKAEIQRQRDQTRQHSNSASAGSPKPHPSNDIAAGVRHSLNVLQVIGTQFDDLKASFSLPKTIDFRSSDGTILSVTPSQPLPTFFKTINTPELVLNHVNQDLLTYTRYLEQTLLNLDGIQRWGDVTVQKGRRCAVGKVQAEISRVDTYQRQVWAAARKMVMGGKANDAGSS